MYKKMKQFKGYQYAIVGVEFWLCGYVRLRDDSTIKNFESIECHGGITYKSNKFHHFEAPGTWIGFDTMHAFDGPETQNVIYVEAECRRIIDQLINLEKVEKIRDLLAKAQERMENNKKWLGESYHNATEFYFEDVTEIGVLEKVLKILEEEIE